MFIRLLKDFIKIGIECLGGACLLAFFFMYLYLFAKQHGVKEAIKKWIRQFRVDTAFRSVFFLALYTSLILMKTVLGRYIWYDPYGRIFLDWSLFDEYGQVSLVIVENIALFIPFTFLVFLNMDRLADRMNLIKRGVLSAATGFLFSTFIELVQLLTRLGTFQFSDIFYNTIGGIIGVLLYFVFSYLRLWFRKR